MAGRKKGTPLEEEIVDVCLYSRETGYRAYSDAQLRVVAEEERPELDRLLGLAYVDSEWRVGAFVATVLSGKRRYNAIFLGDFERAREEIARCLKHPGPFDRSDQAEQPIIYHMHGVFGEDLVTASESAEALERLLDCGVYPRHRMARQIAIHLCFGGDPNRTKPAVTEQLNSLVRAIVASKKCRPQIVRACDDIKTWDDANAIIRAYANFA